MLPIFAGGGDIRTKKPAALQSEPAGDEGVSTGVPTDKAAGIAKPPRLVGHGGEVQVNHLRVPGLT
jgi:hypothetical protein